MATFHPAQWVLAEYSRQCPDVFRNADTFRKTDPDSPWWFMTSRQCQAWLKDYLHTHPYVQRIPAHGAFITLTDAADGRGTDLLALVVGAGATSQKGVHPTMTTFLPVAGTTGGTLSALRSELARHFWRAVLPVLFYLCAENTDWGGTGVPLRPTPKKVRRRGERFFEPPQVKVLDVGVRVGAALRQLHQHFREQTADAQNSGPSGGRCLRPHIRRAHWQGYRTGQKKPGHTTETGDALDSAGFC